MLADKTKTGKSKAGKSKAGKTKPSKGTAFDLLRTHPKPGKRAGYVRATAKYPTRPVMTAAEWSALRNICTTKTKYQP